MKLQITKESQFIFLWAASCKTLNHWMLNVVGKYSARLFCLIEQRVIIKSSQSQCLSKLLFTMATIVLTACDVVSSPLGLATIQEPR